MEPLVYIVILNWNGYEDTIQCIESVQQMTYSNYKIVVVDNGSTDDSISLISTKFPNITLIRQKDNLGYSGGNNLGIKFSLEQKVDYVLLLNNDTKVDRKLLTELTAIANKDPNIGIVGPTIYYLDQPDIANSVGGYFDLNNPYPFRSYESSVQSENNEKEVEYVTGSCLLIKKEVFLNIGLLSEDYFLYVEDMDFCFRVKRSGYKIVVSLKSKVWHSVSKSTGGEGNYIGSYYVNRNKYMFARKNLKNKLKSYILLFHGSFSEFIVFVREKNLTKAKSVLKGTIDGLLNVKGKSKFIS